MELLFFLSSDLHSRSSSISDYYSVECADCKAAATTDVKPEDEKLYIKKLRNCMNEGVYFPSGATKLFDFLYLAGEDEAANLPLLSELGITHVINCAAG